MLLISDLYEKVRRSVKEQDILQLAISLEVLKREGLDFGYLEQHNSIVSFVLKQSVVKHCWNEDIFALLVLNGAKLVNNEGVSNLHLSGLSYVPDLPRVLKKFCSAEDLAAYNKDGTSLLSELLVYPYKNDGYLDTVNVILEKGVNVNYRNLNGSTPLMLVCAQEGDLSRNIHFLLRTGANMYAKDRLGRSVLAYSLDNKTHLQILIDAGLEISLTGDLDQDDMLREALEIAVHRHDQEVYEMLVTPAKSVHPNMYIPTFENATGLSQLNTDNVKKIKNSKRVKKCRDIEIRMAIIEYTRDALSSIEATKRDGSTTDETHYPHLSFLEHIISYDKELQFVRKAIKKLSRGDSRFAWMVANANQIYNFPILYNFVQEYGEDYHHVKIT